MATRIAHISDLHFPAKSAEQVRALRHSLKATQPDIIVVSGDLTRNGTSDEFREAKTFIDSLAPPKIIVPGNHDIPVPGLVARFWEPFALFETFFPDSPTYIETPDLIIATLNSSVGWQVGLDWSLGNVLPDRLDAAAGVLATHRSVRLGIVTCHHPFHRHPLDPVRSRTTNGETAFARLCSAGMDVLLHGHLHRACCRCFRRNDGGEAFEICANTALSNRQRGGPASYNIIDVEHRTWKLHVVVWRDGSYQQ